MYITKARTWALVYYFNPSYIFNTCFFNNNKILELNKEARLLLTL